MTFINRHCKRVKLMVAAAVALAVPVAAAQATPSCSADTKLITLFATVRNKHGEILPKLSESNFSLLEEGRPQSIHCFSSQSELPLALGFLVDSSPNQNQNLDQERTASSSFSHHMLREDQDKIFLIHFDHDTELLQDLTASKQKLDDAFNALQAPQLKKPNDSSSSGDNYPSSRGGSSQRMGSTTLLYDAIYLGSTELMQKQTGRKVMIVLSDGVDRGSASPLRSCASYRS